MATSFVEYSSKGFWCDDAYLEVWAYLFVKEVEACNWQTNSDLEKRILTDWYLAATAGFMGCIDLRLDDIIESDNDKAFLLSVAGNLQDKLLKLTTVLPPYLMAAIENEIKGVKWMQPPLAKSIAKVGLLFQQLLNGNLDTKVNSPLDYLSQEQWNEI
jgi:hypothetical protein